MTKLRADLLKWYKKNYRQLPWRETSNPYKIWISEIMLQQTRVAAVIPLYNNFLKHFPTLKKLASAKESEVLEQWAGLGYYSRAKNIHKASKLLEKTGFPKSHEDLLKLPGFGPYTARAVSSFAFHQEVGVLDGNVIRVLSRILAKKINWWTTSGRNQLQELADQLAKGKEAHLVNQALIELGATTCLPKNPSCMVCPWQKHCQAFKVHKQEEFPAKKSKRKTELWQWTIYTIKRGEKFALIPNHYAPFLKGHLIHPGNVKLVTTKPQKFDFKHSVTHHEIFVNIKCISLNQLKLSSRSWSRHYGLQQLSDIEWVDKATLKTKSQSSYIQKVLQRE